MKGRSPALADGTADRRATDRYLPALALGFAGYVVFGKSFAYLGLPPLFIGEILFAFGLMAFLASGCTTVLVATAQRGPAQGLGPAAHSAGLGRLWNRCSARRSRSMPASPSSSRPHYYDLLAFQDDHRSFDTLLEDLAGSRSNIFAYYRFFCSRIYPHQRALTDDHEIECASTFNGLCLYRTVAYRLGSYLQPGPSICEHLVFNRRLADITGAKMLIDPGLILHTPVDHFQQSFLPFAWRLLRKLVASPLLKARLALKAPGSSAVG